VSERWVSKVLMHEVPILEVAFGTVQLLREP
jgi:hypothetical protein